MKVTKIVITALYVLAAAFIAVAGAGALSYGILRGFLAVGLGAAMVVALVLWWFLRKRCERLCRTASRIVAVGFVVALTLSAVATAQIISRYADEDAPTDAVMVVLGCGLSRVDGVSPSLVMHRRLVAAEQYLHANPQTICVLSGGQGPDENITEAQAMYTYLVNAGIAPQRLFKEEASTSTRENLRFSQELMLENGLLSNAQSLIVVTDGFHEFRAHALARELGFESYSVSSKAPIAIVLFYVLREIPGIITQVWL